MSDRASDALLGGLWVLVLGTAATGADTFWECDDGGSFDEPSCWMDDLVPGPTDTAVFDLGNLYTVSFPVSGLTDRLVIRSGLVTFDFQETMYALLNPGFPTPSVVVGDDVIANAGLTVSGGTIAGQFVDLGRSIGTFGLVLVAGEDSALAADAQLHVGHEGSGMLTIEDAGAVSSTLAVLGLGSSAVGMADVHGSGSTWSCAGDLTVGQGGAGFLTIEGGATVDSGSAIIAQQVGSVGEVTVAGPGSSWTIDGPLDVGMVGHGFLTIADGASVSNEVFATIGTARFGDFPFFEYGVGEVRVEGTGSLWQVNGDLDVGLDGLGTLILSAGGRVGVQGNLFQPGFIAPQIVIELAGPDDYQEAAIEVSDMTTDFEVEVRLIDGFVPQVGDSFVIVTAGLSVGIFEFLLPALPPPLGWEVIQDAGVVEIRVPEPLPGDANGDGVVDVLDLIEVILSWGPCPPPPDPCPTDFNGDGVVDVLDLIEVVVNWS